MVAAICTLNLVSGKRMLSFAIKTCWPAKGYYGLAWSVYSSVVGRGGEVQFDQNASMEIKFGARTRPPGSKFHEISGSLPPTAQHSVQFHEGE
jgi:hypothetical protein